MEEQLRGQDLRWRPNANASNGCGNALRKARPRVTRQACGRMPARDVARGCHDAASTGCGQKSRLRNGGNRAGNQRTVSIREINRVRLSPPESGGTVHVLLDHSEHVEPVRCLVNAQRYSVLCSNGEETWPFLADERGSWSAAPLRVWAWFRPKQCRALRSRA